MEHDNLLTVSAALSRLSDKTGHLWTVSDLLQSAMSCNPLQAKPDKVSPVEVCLHVGNTPMVEVSRREIPWEMAILSSEEIEQLLNSGTTYAKYAVGNDELIWTTLPETDNPLSLGEMEYLQTKIFLTPVCVNIDMVRVPEAVIEKILSDKAVWPLNLSQNKQEKQHFAKATPKQKLQEEEILKWLVKNGYNPKSLPKSPSGKAGIKSQVRKIVETNIHLFTGTTFKKAWERLLYSGEIKYSL